MDLNQIVKIFIFSESGFEAYEEGNSVIDYLNFNIGWKTHPDCN